MYRDSRLCSQPDLDYISLGNNTLDIFRYFYSFTPRKGKKKTPEWNYHQSTIHLRSYHQGLSSFLPLTHPSIIRLSSLFLLSTLCVYPSSPSSPSTDPSPAISRRLTQSSYLCMHREYLIYFNVFPSRTICSTTFYNRRSFNHKLLCITYGTHWITR